MGNLPPGVEDEEGKAEAAVPLEDWLDGIFDEPEIVEQPTSAEYKNGKKNEYLNTFINKITGIAILGQL